MVSVFKSLLTFVGSHIVEAVLLCDILLQVHRVLGTPLVVHQESGWRLCQAVDSVEGRLPVVQGRRTFLFEMGHFGVRGKLSEGKFLDLSEALIGISFRVVTWSCGIGWIVSIGIFLIWR